MPVSRLARVGSRTSASRHVTLWQPEQGGHVGFPHGRYPGGVLKMPRAVIGWLAEHG